MLTGELLDDGLGGVWRALGGIAAALVLLLVLAVFVPVVVIVSIVHAITPMGRLPLHPSSPAPPIPARAPITLSPPRVDLLPAAGDRVVKTARNYLGVPYFFGGTNPVTGLDCSGLVQLVFHQLGIRLPRTAQLQYEATPRIEADQLQPGDLVFFARTYDDPHDWITHVGIYIGAGQQINAPTDGQVVSIQPVFSGFWGAHFVSGGRVAGA